MKIALGADSYGLLLKNSIKDHLLSNSHEVTDFGVNDADDTTPYYETACKVAQLVSVAEFERAILFCATGMGMAIIANKHPGIYAAVCESRFGAEKSRSINNANVLTLGAMVTTDVVATDIVDIWLKTEFTHGWDTSIQEWLQNSMTDISAIEEKQFTNTE